MNLNQLRIFYYAAREGSQSLAANALCISQPAVNKGLYRLQEDEGVQLFSKDGNRLYVTDAGARLYELAEEIFELEHKCDVLMEAARNEEHNTLTLDASLSFGDYYAPELIMKYKKALPNVHISLNAMPTSELLSRSLKMQNDLAFYSYRVDNKNLVMESILSENLVIITLLKHRFSKLKYINPEDLDDETIIAHEKGSIQKQIIDNMVQEHKLKIKRLGVDYTSNEAIKGAVLLGEGIALISEKAVKQEIKSGELYAVQVGKKPLRRKLYMAWHRDRPMTKKLQTLIEINRESFKN